MKSKLFEGLDKMNYSYVVESQEKVMMIALMILEMHLSSIIFSLIVIFLYIL